MIPDGISRLIASCGMVVASALCLGSDPQPLQIREREGQPEVFLPSEPVAPVGGMRYRLAVESSPDLSTWGSPKALQPSEDPSAPFRLTPPDGTAGFFRLHLTLEDTGAAADGAELFGYNRVFAGELRQMGYPTVEAFAAAFTPTNAYLPGISFDPTTAGYWVEFNTDPEILNGRLPPNSPDRRLHDFRLNAEEMARFRTNGFVVSERLGSPTFADRFYAVFADDLPVFISADAVLHAWHWSYQAMLGELEEVQLAQSFQKVLDGMAAELPGVSGAIADGPLGTSLLDADLFLTVARRLLQLSDLTGEPPVPSALGQEARVADVMAAIKAGTYQPAYPLWGQPRRLDFSQFTVRGHYTRSWGLAAYFRTLQWLALADLRIAGPDSPPRELGTALVLQELHDRSGSAATWEAVDTLLREFVGTPDSLGLRELGPLRTAAGLTLEAAQEPGRLEAFQSALLAGDFGVQTYASATYPASFGPAQTQLPRTFSVSGKRFIPDGWATAQVTFDRIRWNTDLPDGKTFFGKVVRRLPTALDVAFGVLGNTQVTPEIASLIQGGGNPVRDRLPYHHNLAAVKATLDRRDPSAWQDSIYGRWLHALRMLSAPTTDPRYPEAMRTRAWSHKTINTQLASWTQLRHDTVLYAAQPYTSIILCEYPAGYVEPRVEFWNAMRTLADTTAEALNRLTAEGSVVVAGVDQSGNPKNELVDAAARRTARRDHCRNFAQQMQILEEMARKELAAEPFSEAEIQFIRGTMNSQDREYLGKTYDGWYPFLFYEDYGQNVAGTQDYSASDLQDALVTDIHTAPPDGVPGGYPGGVLHEAVGHVDLLLIAVDSGPGRMVYAGPTLSHYELTEGPGLKRLTDQEWGLRLLHTKPERPFWTRDYLVPK